MSPKHRVPITHVLQLRAAQRLRQGVRELRGAGVQELRRETCQHAGPYAGSTTASLHLCPCLVQCLFSAPVRLSQARGAGGNCAQQTLTAGLSCCMCRHAAGVHSTHPLAAQLPPPHDVLPLFARAAAARVEQRACGAPQPDEKAQPWRVRHGNAGALTSDTRHALHGSSGLRAQRVSSGTERGEAAADVAEACEDNVSLLCQSVHTSSRAKALHTSRAGKQGRSDPARATVRRIGRRRSAPPSRVSLQPQQTRPLSLQLAALGRHTTSERRALAWLHGWCPRVQQAGGPAGCRLPNNRCPARAPPHPATLAARSPAPPPWTTLAALVMTPARAPEESRTATCQLPTSGAEACTRMQPG